MAVIVGIVYLLVGLGASSEVDSWGAIERMALIFMWPLAFGFWLGERCEENALKNAAKRKRVS